MEKIEKGFIHLGTRFSESRTAKIFLPFLRTFLIPNREVSATPEYHFRDLMGIIFLMSDSSNEEKCAALYRLYDYSNNYSLSKLEIEHMLSRLLMKVDEFTKELINENGLKINGKVIEGNDKQMVFLYFL